MYVWSRTLSIIDFEVQMNDLRLAQVHNIYRLIIYTVCATCIYDVCGVECCIRLCLRRTRASKLWSNRRREYSISLTANCVAELNNPASEIVWLTKARMQTSTFIHMHRCSQCVLRLTKQNAENCILIRFHFRINVNFDAFFFAGHGYQAHSIPYPIQYCGPTLHCDALEYSQHGEANIIETGDTEIRSLPFL